ncbi:MAG: hypothetical protein ACRDJY_12205 [Thermoleophilaceae bacterium]
MTRIRRTFIATLVASAVTAATFGAAPSSAVQATASACNYSIWKITKREHVTCRKAKKVLKNDPRISGEGEKLPGWSCSYGKSIIPEGKCSKSGTNKSFKYTQK